ncbi:MAG: M28 family peptidase [Algicola sp.]|nr:M28 family peptidase [Algicola sp.]
MKKALVFVLGALVLSCGTQKPQTPQSTTPQPSTTTTSKVADVTTFVETITSEELKELLYTYASDDFEGRETGQPGQKKAVQFLRNNYMNMGVAAALPNNNYFQEVPLEITQTPTATLTTNGKTFNYTDDFIAVLGNKDETLTVNNFVFAGYGIESDSYSDYENIDVAGKVVLIKSGEPKDANGNYKISGNKLPSAWSDFNQEFSLKYRKAKEKGVKTLLFYHPDVYHMAVMRYGNNTEKMKLKADTESLSLFLIDTPLAKSLLTHIETENTPRVVNSPVTLSYKSNSKSIISENVLAYIKGSEKPDELIVLSAHLDHEGIKDGEIYNGADDDGSGCVALLEIAEAFKIASKNGMAPKRSILFLHVTAEEKGLLGSQYYTDFDPVFPLENTVANLNIDMIGRVDPKHEKTGDDNYIYLIGSDKLSTELHQISEEVNKKYVGLNFDYTYNDDNDPNRFYYRSDHYNFVKNNIPAIFYFNGTHADYHRPSDTVEKIRYDLLEKRTRLIFHTAWELANRPNRITVDKSN